MHKNIIYIFKEKSKITYGDTGVLNLFARSELMKVRMARQEDGELENVYGIHLHL